MNDITSMATDWQKESFAESGVRVQWLGRISYDDALDLQEQLLDGVVTGDLPEHLLLLEHEPVYTIGRTRDQSSLQASAALPHPVRVVNRGGQATYHGPGQLVGYPILDLRTRGRDLHRYLRALEQLVIDTLGDFDVAAGRRESLTGVWVQDRKICSIGVGIRKWVTMHGFALNIDGPLDGFRAIIPCGIQNVRITSLREETGLCPSLEAVAQSVAGHLPRLLDVLVTE